MTESDNKVRIKFFSKPRTQASLFHYVKDAPDPSVFKDIDWSFLRHPFRTMQQARKEPRSKPSLFHYLDEEPKSHYTMKEFFSDFFTGFRNPLFIPSFFSDPESVALERAQGRTRKIEALILSVILHGAIVLLVAFILLHGGKSDLANENIVYVKNPIYMPDDLGDGQNGGGGGGGGKNQPAPPVTGVIPETTRTEMIAPDPDNPKPLVPVEDLMAKAPIVQMPIDIPADRTLPIGDISAPPNYSVSSGPGSGGGIGTGRGTGMGPGSGDGVGPGSGGGMGGGSGGGMGSGIGPYVSGKDVKEPILLANPPPAYTEDGRKARIQGTVVLEAIVRKNGTIDSFKVVRGLGHGLDESAISTIATKWRFKPGTKNGVPVDVIGTIEVSFTIH